jgi:hypothetical protein
MKNGCGVKPQPFFLVPLAGIELATFALRMRKKYHFWVFKGVEK